MTATVVDVNEVSLNSVLYKIKGGVQSQLSSIYPQKQVTGDYTKDSQQRASVLALSDWRGGIGVKKMRAPEQVNRSWWSTCSQRYRGHLVLPGLATVTAVSGVSGSFTIGAMGELNGEIYAAFGTSVRKYNNTTDSWGSSLATLPAVATHALSFRMGGTVYLAFATSGGYTYTSDGVAFTDDTKDAKFLAYWDDRLWGIDTTGQLWFSTAIGVETNDAQLPLPDNSVTSMFVGRLPNGELALYVGTTYGLFAHDIDNAKLIPTALSEPSISQHPDNGKGTTRWRDYTFFSAGNGIFQYGVGGETAAIRVMGPDRDDGLPSDKRGVIRQLLGTTNELLAVLDSTSAPGSMNMFGSRGALSAAAVIAPDTGFSHILGWDEKGWESKWLGGNTATAISCAYVSNAYSTYRLWWAHNQRVYYMALPRDIVNPEELVTFPYAASSDHETAWFNADQEEVDKLALELRIELAGASATETAVISYGINYSSSYTQFGTISSDGITTYLFPDSTTPTGTAFRAIRFKISLARGSTTTETPDVLSLTLTYRKKLPAKYSHTFEIDMSSQHGGRSPKELRAALIAAIESTTLVEFTFRDDAGLTRNYWVDVVQGMGLEQTGLDERGSSLVSCVEP